MCLITVGPLAKVAWNVLASAEKQGNDDLCGYAYVSAGKVIVKRGFQDIAALQRDIAHIAELSTVVMIHQRQATAGTIDVDNCHPFLLPSSGYAMAHNGIFGGGMGSHSDTWLYAQLLDTMNANWVDDPVVVAAMSMIIAGSRVAVMTPERTLLLDPEDWHAYGGCQYSNPYYLPRAKPAKKHAKGPKVDALDEGIGCAYCHDTAVLWADDEPLCEYCSRHIAEPCSYCGELTAGLGDAGEPVCSKCNSK